MNILYLGYWSVSDGLSESTIRPHLEVLDAIPEVDKIVYVSIERTLESVTCPWSIATMDFVPYYSPPKLLLRDKIADFTKLPNLLVKLCEERSIDKIICRSSLAGAIGYLVWKRVKTPYFVESFEPHADYMLESGVWKKWDIRYRLQKFFEKRQKETASAIMPVSNNYKMHLMEREQVKCPMDVVPCSVDLEKFQFDKAKRTEIRRQFGIPNEATVGIYVGKFGGIYYEEEAYRFFKNCNDQINDFHLLILTTEPNDKIINGLQAASFPIERCQVAKVAHHEVAAYLSATDFAFNFHRKTKWSFALSPIKNGEYWANGLPIVIADGIGDDSVIIKTNKQGGLVVDFENELTTRILQGQIDQNAMDRIGNECVILAGKYRNPMVVRDVYLNYIVASEK